MCVFILEGPERALTWQRVAFLQGLNGPICCAQLKKSNSFLVYLNNNAGQ